MSSRPFVTRNGYCPFAGPTGRTTKLFFRGRFVLEVNGGIPLSDLRARYMAMRIKEGGEIPC